MIQARNELIPERERETSIAANVMDFSWFEKIDYRKEDGIVFFVSGVFYYFKREDVKKLFTAMAKRFKAGKIVFDATNATGLKSMAKTWLESSDMKNVGVYFSIEDESELKAWSDDFTQVIRKGYMTGYRLLDKRYGFVANCIFRFVDKTKRCQVIEITFA